MNLVKIMFIITNDNKHLYVDMNNLLNESIDLPFFITEYTEDLLDKDSIESLLEYLYKLEDISIEKIEKISQQPYIVRFPKDDEKRFEVLLYKIDISNDFNLLKQNNLIKIHIEEYLTNLLDRIKNINNFKDNINSLPYLYFLHNNLKYLSTQEIEFKSLSLEEALNYEDDIVDLKINHFNNLTNFSSTPDESKMLDRDSCIRIFGTPSEIVKYMYTKSNRWTKKLIVIIDKKINKVIGMLSYMQGNSDAFKDQVYINIITILDNYNTPYFNFHLIELLKKELIKESKNFTIKINISITNKFIINMFKVSEFLESSIVFRYDIKNEN